MSSYGTASLRKLDTCHEEIQQVCFEVIPVFDHTIIWGARGEKAQNECYATGTSNARWLESKHNAIHPGKSMAIDIAPWYATRPHIRWNQEEEFMYLAGHMMMAAASLGIHMRWGADWDQDKDLHDRNKPFDLGHFELIS